MSIARTEEIERRLIAQAQETEALRRRMAALYDMIKQLGGGLGGLFGSSSAIALGRAVGVITARSGTTLGSGTANLSTAPAGTLIEGTTAVVIKNLYDMQIADNAWLVAVKEPDWWLVIAVDDCASLS